MKIALASDLHLEFSDIILKNTENADVLVLSGDILVAEDLHNHPEVHPNDPVVIPNLGRIQASAQRFRDFIKRCSFQFPHVVVIAGNHEFYHGNWKASIQYLRDEYSKFTNVYFLEQELKTIDDVTFIGGTLWTDCNKGDPLTLHALGDMMNDFRVIRNDELGFTKLRPAHTMHRHRQTMQFMKVMLPTLTNSKVVVVGHHAPSPLSIHDRYKHNVHSLMNGGYMSDLSEFILDHPQIKLWTHGHMHQPFDYKIGDTRVVCNPRGYAGHDEQADVFELKFIEV
jgi:Icc-related predicted phosphoesterase